MNIFKFNFDGSKLDNGIASFGFVIRNNDGNVLLAGSDHLVLQVVFCRLRLRVSLRGLNEQFLVGTFRVKCVC